MTNKRFPSAPAPFVRRVEVAGRLSTGSWQSEPLDILVDVDELGRDEPKCFVVGTQAVAAALRPLHDPPSETALVPALADEGWLRVYGTNLRPRELHFRGIDTHLPEGPTGVVATLLGGEFRVEHHSDSLNRVPDLEVRFVLRGAVPPLGVVHIPTSHVDGRVEVETSHAELEIPVDLPWRASLEPSYVTGESDAGRRERVLRWALVLRRRDPPTGAMTAALVDEARQFADDFLLVWSFAARRWLAWHSYSFPTANGYTEVHRATRAARDSERHREDSPLALHEQRAFVCMGVAAYRAARDDGRDLLLPLAMAISANERLYIEQRFSTLFMAVEKLKDQHSRIRGLHPILPDDEFKKVRERLGDAISKLRDEVPKQKRKDMRAKLGELNRPSISTILQSLLDEFAVDWRDLYPASLDKGSPPFIGIRDKLFHSADKVTSHRLFLETERVRAVLERLLLRMLGWENIGGAPGALHHLLQKELGDE